MRGDFIHPEPVSIHPCLVPDIEKLGKAGIGRKGDVPKVEAPVLVLADHADCRRCIILSLTCRMKNVISVSEKVVFSPNKISQFPEPG